MRAPIRASVAFLCLAVACAAGGATNRSAGASGVISLQGIDCQSCGVNVVAALEREPGVGDAAFDRERAEVTVHYDASRTDMDALLAVVHDIGYDASVGAGQGRYVPEVEFDPGLDVQKISVGGAKVDLDAHRVPGKVTVFDFYAAWCKPCREVDHHMKKVLAAHGDVALRKIDIVDWDSPVAGQHLGGASELPYVEVYGPSGKAVERISGLDLQRLDRAIAKARGR